MVLIVIRANQDNNSLLTQVRSHNESPDDRVNKNNDDQNIRYLSSKGLKAVNYKLIRFQWVGPAVQSVGHKCV